MSVFIVRRFSLHLIFVHRHSFVVSTSRAVDYFAFDFDYFVLFCCASRACFSALRSLFTLGRLRAIPDVLCVAAACRSHVTFPAMASFADSELRSRCV